MSSAVPLRSPLAERGPRAEQIGRQIAGLLPRHTHYVQPLSGTLEVLLHKPCSPLETVNDVDRELLTFWKVLRDRPADLARACTLTPHSRVDFTAAVSGSRALGDVDEVEVARRVWLRLNHSQVGTARMRPQWQSASAHRKMASGLGAAVDQMADAAARIKSVSLESAHPVELIGAIERQLGVCIYLDLRTDVFGAQGASLIQRARVEPIEVLRAVSRAKAAVVIRAERDTVAASPVRGWTYTSVGEPREGSAVHLWSNRVLSMQEHLFELRDCGGSAP